MAGLLNAFTTGNPFRGTKTLGNSIWKDLFGGGATRWFHPKKIVIIPFPCFAFFFCSSDTAVALLFFTKPAFWERRGGSQARRAPEQEKTVACYDGGAPRFFFLNVPQFENLRPLPKNYLGKNQELLPDEKSHGYRYTTRITQKKMVYFRRFRD